MFVRTLILSLLLLMFQQSDSSKLAGQLSARKASNDSASASQQDPCAGLRRDIAGTQRAYERLKADYDKVSRELEALRRQGGGGASNELAAARSEIANLKEKLSNAEQALRNLREQTAPLRTENERLKSENGGLQNSKRELETKLRTAENNLSELRQQSAPIRSERDNLRGQLGEQQTRLAALQKQYDALSVAANSNKEASETMAAKFSACTEQLEKNPGVLLDTAIASLTASGAGGSGGSGSDTAIRIDGTQGKTHIIRDLVIGTLDISFDSKEVRPDHSFPLKAVFKPHPVLQPGSLQGADERNITWHIEMQYAPKHLTATYDRQQSGNKEPRRTVDATEEQTWVWQLQTTKDFESDLSDLILFAGYELQGDSKTRDLLREPIKLSIPPGPGFFALFKENLSWILGVIATILGICTGYLGLKQKKQSAQQNAPQGGQTQTEPKT
jgi:predicted  nucleic acid-binding Zn-ribbon protein